MHEDLMRDGSVPLNRFCESCTANWFLSAFDGCIKNEQPEVPCQIDACWPTIVASYQVVKRRECGCAACLQASQREPSEARRRPCWRLTSLWHRLLRWCW